MEGQNCDRPKPGFFNLAEENLHGALACFCNGHSSQCSSSLDYFVYNQTAEFIDTTSDSFGAIDSNGNDLVTYAVTNMNAITVDVPSVNEDIYFTLSKAFTGNQLYSFNQDLSFFIGNYF